jgi:hypothetical protein
MVFGGGGQPSSYPFQYACELSPYCYNAGKIEVITDTTGSRTIMDERHGNEWVCKSDR